MILWRQRAKYRMHVSPRAAFGAGILGFLSIVAVLSLVTLWVDSSSAGLVPHVERASRVAAASLQARSDLAQELADARDPHSHVAARLRAVTLNFNWTQRLVAREGTRADARRAAVILTRAHRLDRDFQTLSAVLAAGETGRAAYVDDAVIEPQVTRLEASVDAETRAAERRSAQLLNALTTRRQALHRVTTVVIALGLVLLIIFLLLITRFQRRVLHEAEALRESEERFRLAFESASLGVAIVSTDRSTRRFNKALCDMLGYDLDEMQSRRLKEFVHPDDVEVGRDLEAQLVAGSIDQYQVEKRYVHRDGHSVWVILSASAVRDRSRRTRYLIGLLQDITTLRTAADEIRFNEERFRGAFTHSAAGMTLLSPSGVVVEANAAMGTMLGYTPRDLIGKPLLSLLDPAERDEAREEGIQLMRGELSHYESERRYRARDGRLVWCLTTVAPIHNPDGSIAHYISQHQDITDRKRSEEALTHQARHDALTGLPNRTLLRERLDAAIAGAMRSHAPLALLFLDLNRFKDVNDTFGNHVGDALLERIARRLASSVRGPETIARLGGDEFAVVLPGADAAAAGLEARRLLSILDAPFHVLDHVFDVGVSIGIALYPEQGTDSSTLMRRADVAMYAAKRMERGHMVYAPEQDPTDPERLRLVSELRSAIEEGTLFLHYQPQVDLATGEMRQVEALVRWQHPERGLLMPGVFIPVAEENGLTRRLTEWVMREALQQLSIWHRQGLDLRVAINLSARTLHDEDLGRSVRRLLDTFRVPGSSLVLEITESGIMLDPEGSLQTLIELHRMGIELSIDDFGTGYSSLSYLQRLPAREIKVDRSFVTDMVTNPDSAIIVRSIVDLARNLGLRVVAEGVEDADTLEALRRLGSDMAQGYYLSRPIAPSAIAPLVLPAAG